MRSFSAAASASARALSRDKNATAPSHRSHFSYAESMATRVMPVGATAPPSAVIRAYSSSALSNAPHSPYALIAAVHVYVVRGKSADSKTSAARVGPAARTRRDEKLRVQLRVRSTAASRSPRSPETEELLRPTLFLHPLRRLGVLRVRLGGDGLDGSEHPFGVCELPATPYAQMSADAMGTPGEMPSSRMSSTNAAAAFAPTLPPLAAPRMSAGIVWVVGETPAARMSR